ncbi:MAG TPA: hypothetical protein VGG85_10555, partial [Terracidiphilus sp.]
AQDLLYRTLQVVVSEKSKNSTKIMEGVLVGVEKGLLRRALIGVDPFSWTVLGESKKENLPCDKPIRPIRRSAGGVTQGTPRNNREREDFPS